MGANHSRLSAVVVIIFLTLALLACNLGFLAESEPPETIQTRPLVLILAPVNNSIYAEGINVQIHAIAQDSLAGVARIEFRLNDLQTLGESMAQNPDGDLSLEAHITWKTAGKQAHQIIAEAFRVDGSSLGESSVRITVTDVPTAAVLDNPALVPVATSAAENAANNSATSIPTLTPNPNDLGILSGPNASVTATSLPVRQGPGTHYPLVGTLTQGDTVQIVGRNTDSSWWAIAYGGGAAWIIASMVNSEGDLSQIPLVAPPAP